MLFRSKTRSGKKLDKATGKVIVPSVKRGEKGRAVSMSAEDKRAAVTTVLPEAGREVMQPTPKAQAVHVAGTLKRGGMRGEKGHKSGNYPVIQKATHAALHHLNQAHFAVEAGLNHTEHFQNFDAIHANIKGMDKQLHQSLGVARQIGRAHV